MVERLTGTCEKVDYIKRFEDKLDMVKLQIDFDEVYAFGDATEFAKFINKEVMYTKRPDVISGKIVDVVYDLVIVTTIQTVEAKEHVRLIPKNTDRTVCNFKIADVRYGEFYPNRVAIMSSYQRGASPKAKWYDVVCLDKESKQFSLRIFTTNANRDELDNTLDLFVGKYIVFDLESTRYGYQAKEIQALPQDVEASPEVEVAKTVLSKFIADDEDIKSYCDKYDFINVLSTIIDGEPGYGLVRIASELYIIDTLDSITNDIDIRAMKRATICSRGYLLPSKNNWSRPIANVSKCNTIPNLRNDVTLNDILDVTNNNEMSDTKKLYIRIREFVNDIVSIRRNIDEEETGSIGINVHDIKRYFGGLL